MIRIFLRDGWLFIAQYKFSHCEANTMRECNNRQKMASEEKLPLVPLLIDIDFLYKFSMHHSMM